MQQDDSSFISQNEQVMLCSQFALTLTCSNHQFGSQLCPPSCTNLILLLQICACVLSKGGAQIHIVLSQSFCFQYTSITVGYQQEGRLGLGFAKTDVLFNHTLDSKKLRSLSGEVRVCLSPRVFFSFPQPPHLCCVCPWTAGWEAGSRSAGRFCLGSWLKPGTGFIQPWRSLLSVHAVTLEGLQALCSQGIQIFGWSVLVMKGRLRGV